MFPHLYSSRYQSANLHQLLHLPAVVQELGPLFTYSCFHFEDLNHTLLKFIRGTQHIELQIVYGVSVMAKLPYLANKYLTPDTQEYFFYTKMQHTGLRTNMIHLDTGNMH